jgi:hypothetical protein
MRRRLLSLTVLRLLSNAHSMSRRFRGVIFPERIGGAFQFGVLCNPGSRRCLGLEARGGPHPDIMSTEGDAAASRVWTRAACIQTIHPQMSVVFPLSHPASAGTATMTQPECRTAATLRSIGSRCQRVVI